MNYRVLNASLHSTAEAARNFFRGEQGATAFHCEVPIDPADSYSPTLSAVTSDHHTLCIEVLDDVYTTGALEDFLIDCITTARPVRLYIAIPKGLPDTDFKKKMALAQKRGIGIVEVDAGGGKIIQEAVSLSLAGLHPVNCRQFQPKYRGTLA